MKNNTLKKALDQFVSEGKFDGAFIADESGLPLVCTGSDMDTSETQAAVFARIKKSIAMVQDQQGLNSVHEMIFQVANKKKIICRTFLHGSQHLILAITMDSNCRYKRLTSILLHQLENIWEM